MKTKLEAMLKPGGMLSQALERYEYREQQLDMAVAVGEALKKKRPLIVEAATGTGKTLAYLIPALLSGKRVLVSTGTRALQEQLFHKDIPFLQKYLGMKFEAVLLKGRRNYLCLERFEEMKRNPSFRSVQDLQLWPEIQRWAVRTSSGDRAEVDGMPDDYPTWNDLSVGAESCLGSKCQFWEECFVQQARRDAQKADLIVVNHHLFFADLALRQGGRGEILPEVDAVIFDEAHNLEDVATDYFGMQVSNYRIREIVGDIERALDDDDVGGEVDRAEEAARELERASGKFFDKLKDLIKEGRYPLAEVMEQAEAFAEQRRVFLELLKKLGLAVKAVDLGEVGQRLAERCEEIGFELETILAQKDPSFAYIIERRDSGIFLQASPIDLAMELRGRLLKTQESLIFTSATLATGGNFNYFKRRMGFGTTGKGALPVDELLLAPVFNYAEQSLLYVPHKLPAPHDPDFCKNVATIVEYLVKITEGNAFVLFTSYMNMRDVHSRLVDKLEYPVLLQGERSKRELLESFRNTPHSVLFATSSFWEGVDVEGESLSLVIIDKLPFASPSDPLMRARLDLVDERGGNSFAEISLPTAAITLRQGFGRLIRSAEDTGVVAILDSRIAHKRYGSYFLKSLPPAPVVWTAPQVKRWWLRQKEAAIEQ